jgi:RHS repeat-associated protein
MVLPRPRAFRRSDAVHLLHKWGGGSTLKTYVWLSYIFTDPSGLRHNLGLANTETPNPDCTYPTQPYNVLSGADDFYSATISGANGFTGGTVTVVGVDGTVYNFPNAGWQNPGFGVNTLLPSTIEDRNGNIVTISQGSGGKITETDTAGRLAVSISAPVGTNGTVGVSGLSNPYTIRWETMNPSYGSQYEQLGESYPNCDWLGQGANEGSNGVIKSIELPNGEYYTFGYGSYGLLNQITYPTGAVVNYTWTTPSSPNGEIEFPDNGNNQTGCLYAYYAPMVTQRTVKFDGVHTALVQNFSYTTAYSTGVQQATVQTTVYSSNGSTNLGTFKTVYNYAAFLPYIADPEDLTVFPAPMPVEQTVQYYDYGQTNLLETVTKGWQDQFRLGCQLEKIGGSALSGIFYSYGPGLSLTDEKEYDYGQIGGTSQCPQAAEGGPIAAPSGPTRETVTTYYDSFANAPATVKIYLNGASGTLESETDYSYDQSPTSSASAINHDGTNYGPSSTIPRANATTIVRKCLQSVPACSSGNPTTTYSYDETGQVTSMKDPNGNTTQYSHADSYTSGTPPGQTNAYLTKETNALGYFTSFAYGYGDGQLTSATDSNSEVTSYTYNTPPSGCSFPDNLDRLSSIAYPDGGITTYCYNDAAYNPSTPSPSVTTTKAITSSLNEVSTAAFDGMGHTVETMLSDPQGIDYTVTSYDGSGRPYQTYNPTRCSTPTTNCGETTWGLTTYTNDALGRTTLVAEPDGSSVSTSYGSNLTLVTDEAGNQRRTETDGLGRLTNVWEEPNVSGYNYATVYTYDALNDLLSVTQKGGSSSSSNWRPRSFVYDSLSRLTSATNPESGTINYTYDGNSNLLTKIAPSPNQPSTGTATVTTTYSYDVLNRLTGKSYTDGYASNAPTQGVTYGYDGVNVSCPNAPVGDGGGAGTNTIGRRTGMCFGFGSVGGSSGSGGSKSWHYDPMGRIAAENDRFIGLVPPYAGDVYTTIGDGVPTINTNTAYVYYLNGDLLDVFYPGGPLYQFGTTENGAGRVTTAGDDIYNVFWNGTYTPDGQLATALIGWQDGPPAYNGSPISNTYNNRLQPVLISANTAGDAQILNLTYNFNLGNGTTGSDNGNVIQIANGKNSNRTQNFIYDPLNRIQQAYTSGTNWGETYASVATAPGVAPPQTDQGIDPWGNLTNRSGVTGKTTYEPLSCAANTANQLNTCYTYDAAGNLIQNGSANYIYDDENRLIATGGYSYVYDGDGQRIEKCTEGTVPGTCATNATGTLYWKLADGSTQMESDLGGNWTAAYGLIRGRIADRVDIASGSNVDVRYYFQDNLHSTSIVTDCCGNILNESDYYPYGGEIVVSSGDSNRYKFTGKERDSESTLDYFGARHYGSTMGRFMQTDPDSATSLHLVNPQRWNGYAYVLNNPLAYTDPDGLDAAVVNFSMMVGTAGHVGMLAIDDDGTATYARFGPASHGAGNLGGTVAPGSVNIDNNLPKVQFGSDQQPTPDSMRALKEAIAKNDEDGADPSTVRINYFKTSQADTTALKNWFKDQQDAAQRGQGPFSKYRLWGNQNCATFCLRGLVAGNAITNNQASRLSIVPNMLYWQLLSLPKACTEAHDSSGQGTVTVCE